jgi:hypothetical protein
MGNWESTGKIIKDTFAMAKKDKSLYIPPILNLVVSILFVVAAIVVLVRGSDVGGEAGIPGSYIGIAILLIFFAYLASAFLAAALSWMVLETVQGKKASFGRGLGRAFKKTGSLAIYAGISLIVMLIASQLRKRDDEQGIVMAIVKAIFADMIEKAWDIASHLLLPAIVLTNNNFGGAVKEMPSMLKHLPQVLVGGFAFDFVVGWLYLIEALVALLFWWILSGINGTFAVLFAIGLFFVMFLTTYILYSFTKSVYFTMLYIDLHPELKRAGAKGRKPVETEVVAE